MFYKLKSKHEDVFNKSKKNHDTRLPFIFRHDITEILLKVALNTITLKPPFPFILNCLYEFIFLDADAKKSPTSQTTRQSPLDTHFLQDVALYHTCTKTSYDMSTTNFWQVIIMLYFPSKDQQWEQSLPKETYIS